MFRPRLKNLSYYLDKGLTPEEAQKIEEHLQKSDKDKKCLEIMETMGTALGPKGGLSPDFTQKFLENLPDVKRIDQPSFGRITAISGFIMIYRQGCDEGIEAFTEMDLKKGDELRVIGNSIALIELNDGSAIYLNKETSLEFKDDPQHLFLNAGEIFSIMKPQKKPFLVSTPSAMLAVLGTWFSAKVTEKFTTILNVIRGSVMFRNDTGGVVVNKREQVEAARSAKPVPRKIADPYSLIHWTGTLKPKNDIKGAVMKKFLYILIVIAVGVVGFLGYRFYQENLVYEPMSKPKSTTSAAPEPTGTGDQKAAPVMDQTPAQIMMGGDLFVFKPKQPVGTKVLMRMENVQGTEVNVPGVKLPIQNSVNMTQDMRMTVLNETPDGGQETLIEFEHIKMEMKEAKGGVVYDSDKPSDKAAKNPVAAMMNALAATKLHVFTDALGKMVKLEGFEGYMELMAKQMPNSQSGDVTKDSMKVMLSSFSTDMMPDTPIKIGDSWPFQTSLFLPDIGSMVMNTQYTFKDWDKRGGSRCARLEFKGDITGASDPATSQQKTNTMIKEGSTSGKMWYDEATGLMVESVNNQIIVIESKERVPLPSGVREKITMMKITQNINIKIVETNLSR